MAAGMIVACPNCEKKFKPKSDVAGKKIKCPFCTEPFVVPVPKDAKPDKAKPDQIKAGKPKPDADADAPQTKAAPEAAAAPVDDFDADPNPYGIKTVELVPRCPNCTQEMGEHDTICLACGYNTLTRQWGKTEKILGMTANRHVIYLLPPIGSAIFTFFAVICLLILYALVPYWVVGSGWFWWIDSEAVRMWTTLIFIGIFWVAGVFCYKKFIEKPKPDEIKIEDEAK